MLSVLPLHIAITQTSPHLRSVVCRSTQFPASINNVVSQRGSRPATCIVDVDWLKVWVQLVVKARNEDYRDAQLNSVYCMDSNEPLNVVKLTALAGAGPVLADQRPAWTDFFY